MNKAAVVTVGGVVAGVLAFLATNFQLSALTPTGAGIIALVGYLISAIFHVPTPSTGKSLARNLIGR